MKAGFEETRRERDVWMLKAKILNWVNNYLEVKMNLFVVILRYLVPIAVIDEAREAHLAFLDAYYAEGTFIVSGRQAPLAGGVIIARSKSRTSLEDLLKEDPFATKRLAEYQIYEFIPTRYSAEFKAVLDKEVL